MKKNIQFRNYCHVFILLLGVILMSCSKDKDENTKPFCEIERTPKETLTDKTAQLIFLEDKQKFALKYYPDYPTIDEITYCILCFKPANLEINDIVLFSGSLYHFNDNENYMPVVGGTDFYFTEISTISKKQL